MKKRIINMVLGLLPLIIFLLVWEFAISTTSKSQFLFASPSSVFKTFIEYINNGVLITDFIVTGQEVLYGFLMGNSFGAIIGLSLWYSPSVAKLSRPYIIAIGAIPIFAIAPMMIIWFGTGLFAKVMMAALSTVTIAITQAYEGAKNVDDQQVLLLKSFGASHNQVFTKLVIPSSLIWLFNSLKLSVIFAILGAFIGEFISASNGLGYRALKAGGLYDIPLVLSAIIGLIILAFFFSAIISLIEKIVFRWK